MERSKGRKGRGEYTPEINSCFTCVNNRIIIIMVTALRATNMPRPRVSRSILATRAFSVAGPTVWNSLSGHLRDPAIDSEQFRRDLKTYLFVGHSKH